MFLKVESGTKIIKTKIGMWKVSKINYEGMIKRKNFGYIKYVLIQINPIEGKLPAAEGMNNYDK